MRPSLSLFHQSPEANFGTRHSSISDREGACIGSARSADSLFTDNRSSRPGIPNRPLVSSKPATREHRQFTREPITVDYSVEAVTIGSSGGAGAGRLRPWRNEAIRLPVLAHTIGTDVVELRAKGSPWFRRTAT
jgi:hypothetical protein